MSFDYNPFLHMEIVRTEGEGYWKAYCHGCGVDSERTVDDEPIVMHETQSLKPLIDWNKKHLRESHALVESDISNWSKY